MLDRSRDFQEDLRVEKRVSTGDVVLPKTDMKIGRGGA